MGHRWYLHLCSVNKVVVVACKDAAECTMQTNADGSGEFTRVTPRPRVTVTADSDAETAAHLHGEAGAACGPI